MATAGFLKALAQPMRLLILEKTAQKPCCITELAAHTGKKESTVSRHASILKEAGCLIRERKGLHIFCHIANLELVRVLEITDRCVRERQRRSGRSQAGEAALAQSQRSGKYPLPALR